jgi:flagellar biogenesis protein FliO
MAETIRVIAALGGVVLLAVLALRYALPRLMGAAAPSEGPFRLIARFPIEPKKTLYMVRAGDSVMVLGTSERDIHYLASLPPGTVPDSPVARPSPAGSVAKFLRRPRA